MHMTYFQSMQTLWAEYQRFRLGVEERLVRLEAENRKLKEALEAALQQTKPLHIDHITYKVQELHVRDLTGTLNIGLTALADPKQLESWLAEQEKKNENPLEDTEVQFGESGAPGDAGPSTATDLP